ncbi:uncharacterized protein LOC143299132 [Babylonia areolata]|uniref:uncharacterized protein LOC143299132 n=1 Tax=Babylonia areolata TaxID=304850 RepID=UPI003FD2C7A1
MDLSVERLHLLCGEGKELEVRELLDSDWARQQVPPPLLQTCSTDLMTCLHMAATSGNTRLVGLILCRGGDPNAGDHSGMTPLHWAAMLGDTEVVRLLIAGGADIFRRTGDGDTALHVAVLRGHLPVVAEVARTVARWQVESGLLDMGVWRLQNQPRNYGRHTLECLRSAFSLPDAPLVAFPILYTFPQALQDRMLLEVLVDAHRMFRPVEYLGVFQVLEQEERMLGEPRKSALLNLACGLGHADIVAVLMAHGASPDLPVGDALPLHKACQMDQVKVVEVLAGRGARLDVMGGGDGETALHVAAARGLTVTAATLLGHGAPVDARTARGDNTPLHYAAFRGHLHVTLLLLDYRADPQARNSAGLSPNHIARFMARAALRRERREARSRKESKSSSSTSRSTTSSSSTAQDWRDPSPSALLPSSRPPSALLPSPLSVSPSFPPSFIHFPPIL